MMSTERPKRVVFVCVENFNRSQMAEAFARKYGPERVEAYSAGSHPAGRVHPKAIEAMKELGYDLEQHRFRRRRGGTDFLSCRVRFWSCLTRYLIGGEREASQTWSGPGTGLRKWGTSGYSRGGGHQSCTAMEVV
jgi:hypothetical protein